MKKLSKTPTQGNPTNKLLKVTGKQWINSKGRIVAFKATLTDYKGVKYHMEVKTDAPIPKPGKQIVPEMEWQRIVAIMDREFTKIYNRLMDAIQKEYDDEGPQPIGPVIKQK
jgi:hypothetical protein